MTQIIALTGATGFVGRHVADKLKDKGFHVRLLVRSPESAQWLEGYEVIKGALEDEDSLKWLTSDADAVVHCAGAIRARRGDEFERVNYLGTQKLVEASLNAGVKRFIHLSSLAAREPQLSDYAASKRKSEMAVKQTGDNIKWTILRPSAVYGPCDRATLPLFRQLSGRLAFVPGSKGSRFSLIFVEDLAEALAELAGDIGGAEGIHEIADGQVGGYSWAELMAIAGKAQGRKIKHVFLPISVIRIAATFAQAWGMISRGSPILTAGKVRELFHEDWVCHGNLLEDVTDWRPKTDFAKGFRETLDWYRREKWI